MVAHDDPVELVVVGGGNMGAALVGGMLSSGAFSPTDLAIAELDPARRDALGERFPDVAVVADVPACRSAVIAVKPGGAADAVRAVVAAGAQRVLSIAAGVTLATLDAAAGDGVAVVRAMPNTPALVGAGAAAIAGGRAAGTEDLDWAASILGAVGTVDRLPEPLLDAFTGVAGSGPAYVFLVAEALIAAATEQGIDADAAERIVTQLLVGASALLAQEGDPARLREMVTSPGGTTAAGLAELDARDVRAAFGAAVAAATARSRELG